MEFQADLVAVSTTGSDALIHGLYRLQACEGDWQEGIDFMNGQLGDKKAIPDLFAIQTCAGEHRRRILNDPKDGVPPPLPADAASHRVFTERLAQPPKMWAIHPPNTEREENAKRHYIPALIDNEPAWELFQQATKWREALTRSLYESAETEEEPVLISNDEALRLMDERYQDELFDPAYRGVYLNRSVGLECSESSGMIGDKAVDDIETELELLYPEELQEVLAERKQLGDEIKLLEAVQFGYAEVTGDELRHRGEEIRRRDIPKIVEELNKEYDELNAELGDHDRECRSVYLAAARKIGGGWYEYSMSLIELLHYAEHSQFDVEDACQHLQNTMHMTLADGHVSGSERQRILRSANDLQSVLAALDRQADQVGIPQVIQTKFEKTSWRECIQELELPKANEHNIGEWIQVVDSWAVPVDNAFSALRTEVLNELLTTDKKIAAFYGGEPLEQAPPIVRAPKEYATRHPKQERPKQRKLDWWSRFTIADGTIPTLLRLSVAASIVAAVVIAGGMVGTVSVYVYNGLSMPVQVRIADTSVTVPPKRHRLMELNTKATAMLEARSQDDRLLDKIDVTLDRAFANYVYNVAGATPMVEWTMNYGTSSARPPSELGCPKWRTTSVDHIFEEPPDQIESGGSGGVRTVLTAFADMHPQQIMSMIKSETEQQRIIKLHAQWDDLDAKYTMYWLLLANQSDEFPEILQSRLEQSSNHVMALRVQQDTATPDTREAIFAEHRRLAEEHPDDPDMQYIGIRSLSDGADQDAAFLDGYKKWPDNVWFSNAAGYQHAARAEWDAALKCFAQAFRYPPLKDTVGDKMARIRRVVADGDNANLSDLMGSMIVKSSTAYESKMNYQSPGYAYHLLYNGELKQAYRVSKNAKDDPALLILLAASSGADPEWQEAALKLAHEELGSPVLHMYLAALASRSKRPYGVYLEALEELFQNQPSHSPVAALRQVLKNAPSEDFDQHLNGLNLRERGGILATAVTLYPNQVPDKWRRAARALLYTLERPYFPSELP